MTPRSDVAPSSGEEVALRSCERLLLKWFADNGRDLPWRQTRDPWLILMSEMMLQQTQVSRVEQRWSEFVDRFPSASACKAVALADVIAMWSGLGFNRRAINLHRCATHIVDRFDGVVPAELADLLTLPGVGDYTARAVRVFAFELDDAVLDTNVARILARTEGRTMKRREAQELANAVVPSGEGWSWNQCLLDIGATRCRSKKPLCMSCPIHLACDWAGDDSVPDPAKGSAGVSTPQSKFEGSDRQGRGRLLLALQRGSVSGDHLPKAMGWPGDASRAQRVAMTLVVDGLAEHVDGAFRLPTIGDESLAVSTPQDE